MSDPLADWQPRGVDFSVPSTARMYDYYLGGKDNFAVDREAAEQALRTFPQAGVTMRANRGFLVEAVRRATAAGIDQFLDLGTGIPTSPNVHEIARETHPAARVVYVDHDPVVTAHNRALREIDANIGVIEADICEPQAILDHPETRRLIDFDAPVAVLAVSVLHFVAHDKPETIAAALTKAMRSGSYFVASVGTDEDLTEAEQQTIRDAYAGSSAASADFFTPEKVGALRVCWRLLV